MRKVPAVQSYIIRQSEAIRAQSRKTLCHLIKRGQGRKAVGLGTDRENTPMIHNVFIYTSISRIYSLISRQFNIYLKNGATK